jgi:hypothetical protein
MGQVVVNTTLIVAAAQFSVRNPKETVWRGKIHPLNNAVELLLPMQSAAAYAREMV